MRGTEPQHPEVIIGVGPIIKYANTPLSSNQDKFIGSIERHPVSGNYFIVAARQEAIAEITPGGKVVAVRAFPAQWHRQAEGITFAADGTLIIADEGAGKRARLTLYPVSDRQ